MSIISPFARNGGYNDILNAELSEFVSVEPEMSLVVVILLYEKSSVAPGRMFHLTVGERLRVLSFP
jgi:hypothetical protein